MADGTMTEPTERELLNLQVSAMKLERQSFIEHWKDLSLFVAPRRGRFFIEDRNRGDKRYQAIINSKATQARRIAVSGMLAGIMSPSRPWFSYETPDPDLNEFQPVKEWLYKVELIHREILNQSNLYTMAPVMLGELILFGTGCMSHVDDFDDVARFYAHTVGSYMIAQDDKFKINTLAREFEMTTLQMVKKFGYDSCSIQVQTAYDRGNYNAWWPVTHVIMPNKNFNPNNPISKRFTSTMYEPGNNGIDVEKYLERLGFHEFPVYVPRWETTGEDIYGTDCPGMTALGDTKGLQIEEKRKAQGIDKMTNPPLTGPSSVKNVPIRSLPGQATLYDDNSSGNNQLRSLYNVNIPVQELTADIEKVERRIDTAFFVDMFLAISNMAGVQPKNQLELTQRDQERLLQIGPVLERLHGEFLSPMLDRLFNQTVRADILPPAPPELQGRPLKVRYISSLAMAQRAVATSGIDRLTGFVTAMKEAQLTDGKKFNADQAIDEYAAVIGVPPRVILADDVVQQQRQQEQEAVQRAQNIAAATQAAPALKQGADAMKTAQEIAQNRTAPTVSNLS